jgi:hypothetical protein
MGEAHTTLKDSIKILDAVHWVSRAIALLLEVGKELNEVMIRMPGEPLKIE